ncbi:hypothetical protein ACFE33_03040 [Falsihalocynthiibacter sp. SS001]|uniref:hypothetical protein n=1 Tax=Falsihalocynthiibacter sp. SS001 TaxID=3349698 RepID=UPI0036D2DAE5
MNGLWRLLVGLALIALGACYADGPKLERTYQYTGLAFTQTLELFEDGSYRHIVRQSTGNSISTRQGSWGLDHGVIRLAYFNLVVTHKDFAEHRMGYSKVAITNADISSGILGAVVLTVTDERAVEFVSID